MPLTGPSSSVQRLMNLLSSVDVPVGLGGPWRTSACVAKDDGEFEPRLRYVRLNVDVSSFMFDSRLLFLTFSVIANGQ